MNIPRIEGVDELVNEVIDVFLYDGRLLTAKSEDLKGHDFLVPWPQLLDPFETGAWGEATTDASPISYNDLQESESANLRYPPQERERAVATVREWINRWVQSQQCYRQIAQRQQLPRDLDYLAEWIDHDLPWCLLSRAQFDDDTSRFYERVFQAYKAGGMPCGYGGAAPDMKILVFCPGLPPLAERDVPGPLSDSM